MSTVNKALLVGRLGSDPKLNHVGEQNRAVARFSLATDQTYKDRKSGEFVTRPEWHNIVVWGPQAEQAKERFGKGDLVFIAGPLRSRSYQQNDGTTRDITEIEAQEMRMLHKKRSATDSSPDYSSHGEQGGYTASRNGQPQGYATQGSSYGQGGGYKTSTAEQALEMEEDDLPF